MFEVGHDVGELCNDLIEMRINVVEMRVCLLKLGEFLTGVHVLELLSD